MELRMLDTRFERTLEHMFAEARCERLFGGGSQRAMKAYREFSLAEARPVVLLEFPLAGAAYYDVIAGSYTGQLHDAGPLAPCANELCQRAFASAASWEAERHVGIFFERDCAAGEGQQPGISVMHFGQPEVACAFFEAIGQPWRSKAYRAACECLPEGFTALHAGVFPGRAEAGTRLEMVVAEEGRARMASCPAQVAEVLDQLGFTAYDAAMLGRISQLAERSEVVDLQVDVLPDGTLGPTFSFCSIFEHAKPGYTALFAEDGLVGSVCRICEEAGTADGRWREIAGALLARRELPIEAGGLVAVTSYAAPSCLKAKWVASVPQPSKFYIVATTRLG